jgi:hypothetical protein
MPHATNQYGFEGKIFEWATGFSRQLAGQFDYPFLILFSPDGVVREVHFGDAPMQHDDSAWQALRQAVPTWFFYDPFEAPEYTQIGWQQVRQAWFERLLGTPFAPDDLTAAGHPIEFPMTWQVMF